MSKCHHHHHHHHDHCMEPRRERYQESMPMENPSGCAAPSVPIHGRCVMTPQGPICCVTLAHHRMR